MDMIFLSIMIWFQKSLKPYSCNALGAIVQGNLMDLYAIDEKDKSPFTLFEGRERWRIFALARLNAFSQSVVRDSPF